MGYYDPNKDYSLAIKQAKDSGASASEISRLQSERQNKIDAKYGGKDPYKGKSDIMGSGSSKGSSRDVEDAVKDTWDRVYSGGSKELTKGPGYVTGGYTPGAAYGTPMLADNPYYKNPVSGSGADMSRRPDLAGSYAVSNGYTVFYDEDGYAVKARKGVTDYTPHRDINAENGTYNQSGAWSDNEVLTAADRQRIQDIRARMQAGQLSGDEANRLANEIRSGYGYTIDKAGNVTDLGALSSVDARRRAWGLPTNDVSAEQQNYLNLMFPEQGTRDSGALLGSLYELNQGTYQPQGGGTAPGVSAPGTDIMSFEDFLNSSGYSQYSDATQAAIRAAVQNAVRGYQDQIDTANEETNELARQAYINKMLGEKNLDQKLRVNGYAGGMADSQRIATETAYQNNLTELEKQRLATVKELQSAIVNAQLTGDMQTAQELASYLQNIQGQWSNYVQSQQQMANQNYWNQQNLNSQNMESARTYALNLLASGIMPDSSTLTAAGISAGEAASILGSAAGGTQTATPTVTGTRSGTYGGFNNGSLSSSQIQELQKYYGVSADGLWGSRSQAAAGGMTADQAWAKYQNDQGGRVAPLDYATVKANSESGAYGPAYNMVLSDIQFKRAKGADPETLAVVLENALDSNRITQAGAESIMQALGMAM
ncbi:hypothetical protein [uncultured Dysosmobacter sp.]|uniref:hypothetical protein n=1 Tax=uncultured Dysosmobacter sp. TaxID=2591384 RepID=UPI00261CFC7A|nr:hypothetical protein [uncultured Dysosmobacter sp.]